MYCTRCGVELEEKSRFCSQCGAPTGRAQESGPAAVNRLSRPMNEARLGGVCAGVARYMGADVSLVRILWVVLTIWPPGVGLVVYIVCWIVMPKDPLPLAAPAAQPHPANGTT